MMTVLLGAGPAAAFETIRCQLADGFDFPCGKPEGAGYYKARGFWPNGHLGEDWNGSGGGDSDLGDPIYSIGRGIVVQSEDVKVGWGNVVIIRHVFREVTGKIEMVDSLYGHLLERKVKVGQMIEKGQLVGTMGGNNGMYPVHLHLEVRKNLAIGMNRSKFAKDYSNYHSPTAFINAHRQLASDFKKYDVPINTFAPYGGELTEAQERVSGATSSAANTASGSAPSRGFTRTGRGLAIPVINGPGSGYLLRVNPQRGPPRLPQRRRPGHLGPPPYRAARCPLPLRIRMQGRVISGPGLNPRLPMVR
ncbi:M23 family metallopeptidase [Verrucomicrobium spinosum]|uniref:M23 family metallopeptidase n=1 Tax=Verrucomicrobium spinosum TaxID=2736 RepID=UPI00155DBC06|nr:M23 family metallopeptidase [Verrucomicrobium spinosum]